MPVSRRIGQKTRIVALAMGSRWPGADDARLLSTIDDLTDAPYVASRTESDLLCSQRKLESFARSGWFARFRCFVALASQMFCTPAAGYEPKRARIIICSDESLITREAFASELQNYLTSANVEVSDNCITQPLSETYRARFVSAPNRVMRLQLEMARAQPRIRTLGWITGGLPLKETIHQSQVPALALLLEAMLLEFESVQLLLAPALSGPPKSKRAAREVELVSAPPAARMRETVSNRRERVQAHPSTELAASTQRHRGRVGLQSGGGITFLPANVTAPIFGTGSVFDAGRWGVVLELRATLDSNFNIENRAFETSTYAVAIGPRLRLWERDPIWLGAEMRLLGSLSRYRRDDLPDTSYHEWLDLGFGAEWIGRARLSGDVWLVVRTGLQWIPTAKEARIKNGPRRSTGQARVPVLVGLELFF